MQNGLPNAFAVELEASLNRSNFVVAYQSLLVGVENAIKLVTSSCGFISNSSCGPNTMMIVAALIWHILHPVTLILYVWNALPDNVVNAVSLTIFKKHLKTHLFDCC